MQIKGKKVVTLGGLGLVGSAVTRLILQEKPKLVVISSLKRRREEKTLNTLNKEFPNSRILVEWGNVFVSENLKDKNQQAILESRKYRQEFLEGVLSPLNKKILKKSNLYNLILKYKPEIIVDTINTATTFAYTSLYESANNLYQGKSHEKDYRIDLEKHLASLNITQLVRHIQILYEATRQTKTQIYIKVGTSGTGGMGLNIPYTHGEDKPSRELLTKVAIAGAHTQLLQIFGRTPDAPVVKEIKPLAAVAWGEIAFGPLNVNNSSILLQDCPPDKSLKLADYLDIPHKHKGYIKKKNKSLKSVYLDSGENGLFSLEEFKTISALTQMAYITPEEIAQKVIDEIEGKSTGNDIIATLNATSLSPTYRAGIMRDKVIEKMGNLIKKKNTASIAFGILGPPRLSKLLFEAHLLKRIYRTGLKVAKENPQNMAKRLDDFISRDRKVRHSIISIGIPILLSDSKSLLCGDYIKIPPMSKQPVSISKTKVNKWAHTGWVDLRKENMALWQKRFAKLIERIHTEKNNRLSSSSDKIFLKKDTWKPDYSIDVGETVGYILSEEEKGWRVKE